MKKLALTLAIVVGAMFVMAGCGKTVIVQQAAPAAGPQMPEWVMKGSGAFSGDKGKVFRGVGTITGVRNVGLARTSAGDDGRKELAKVFNTYVASMTKIYRRSTMAGDPNVSSEEQDIVEATKVFTKMQLSGVQIVEFYFDSPNNTWYALAEMDLSIFKDFASKHQELGQKAKEYIRDNAAQAFDALEQEEMKQQ